MSFLSHKRSDKLDPPAHIQVFQTDELLASIVFYAMDGVGIFRPAIFANLEGHALRRVCDRWRDIFDTTYLPRWTNFLIMGHSPADDDTNAQDEASLLFIIDRIAACHPLPIQASVYAIPSPFVNQLFHALIQSRRLDGLQLSFDLLASFCAFTPSHELRSLEITAIPLEEANETFIITTSHLERAISHGYFDFLHRLDLENIDLHALVGVQLVQLRTLVLTEPRFGRSPHPPIFHLPELRSLTLEMSDTADEDPRHIVQALSDMPVVEHIKFFQYYSTNHGLIHPPPDLTAMLGTKLTSLSLRTPFHPSTPECVLSLTSLKTLSIVYIYPETFYATLSQPGALPHLRVFYAHSLGRCGPAFASFVTQRLGRLLYIGLSADAMDDPYDNYKPLDSTWTALLASIRSSPTQLMQLNDKGWQAVPRAVAVDDGQDVPRDIVSSFLNRQRTPLIIKLSVARA